MTELLIRFRILSALLILAMVAAAGWALPDLRFDSDINRVFMSDSALSQAQRDFEGRFATRPSPVAVLLTDPDGLDAADIARARTLVDTLEVTEGVIAVASPFSLRLPPAPPAAGAPPGPPVPVPVIAPDQGPEGFGPALAQFRDLDTGLPTLIRDDALLIVAGVDVDARPLADALPDIRAAAATAQADGGPQTQVSGPDVVSLAIADGLKSDLLRINLLGAALVVLVALVLLRDWRLMVIAVLPALAGMEVTLGVAAWIGYPVTVLNNVIPVLMLVLGVSGGLHMAVHLAHSDGPDIRARVSDTLSSVGPAVVLTALTTALAFASILLVQNAQLFEFAMLGAVGMAVAVVTLLPGFAVLGLWLAPAPRVVAPGVARLATRTGLAGLSRPRVTAAAGALALAVSAYGFATLQPWFPLHQNLPRDSALTATDDAIADRFGGVFQAWVELPEGADWADLTRVSEAIRDVAPDETVVSALGLSRLMGSADAPPPDAVLDQLPEAARDRLEDPDTGVRRLAVLVPEPMRSQAALDSYDRIERAALDAGAARVIGLPAIMRHEAPHLIGQLSRSLLLACLTGAVVIALWYRSWRLLPVGLAVNVLPVLVVGGALHLLDQGRLTAPAVLSLTIAFGIAVDDTVHFFNRYRQAERAGQTAPRAAATQALGSAGGVMVLTTILFCAGLAVTALSAFWPVQLFGGMMVLTLAAALLADLVLLPALLELMRRRA